jgi:hypothetical protein
LGRKKAGFVKKPALLKECETMLRYKFRMLKYQN